MNFNKFKKEKYVLLKVANFEYCGGFVDQIFIQNKGRFGVFKPPKNLTQFLVIIYYPIQWSNLIFLI